MVVCDETHERLGDPPADDNQRDPPRRAHLLENQICKHERPVSDPVSSADIALTPRLSCARVLTTGDFECDIGDCSDMQRENSVSRSVLLLVGSLTRPLSCCVLTEEDHGRSSELEGRELELRSEPCQLGHSQVDPIDWRHGRGERQASADETA